jgi:hypothetical protein
MAEYTKKQKIAAHHSRTLWMRYHDGAWAICVCPHEKGWDYDAHGFQWHIGSKPPMGSVEDADIFAHAKKKSDSEKSVKQAL